MTHLRTFRTAAVAAAILSLTLALPVAAATSATRPDQVTVLQTLSVTVLGTSTTYGVPGRPDMEPGQTSAEQGVTVNVTGNSTWSLTVAGTPLTGTAGEIPSWARTVRVDGGIPTTQLSNGMELASDVGAKSLGTWWSLTVPADQPSGVYQGELTFTIALK